MEGLLVVGVEEHRNLKRRPALETRCLLIYKNAWNLMLGSWTFCITMRRLIRADQPRPWMSRGDLDHVS